MKAPLDSIQANLERHRNYESPPLHLWHPSCNGDIAIHINAQGDWYHDGSRIERPSLVRLFASILRREEDGDYYLVTPHEKWRIKVDLHPLLISDVNVVAGDNGTVLEVCLNTDQRVSISAEHPLYLDASLGGVAVIRLRHGLTAVCTRPAWYRLVEMANNDGGKATLTSGSYEVSLVDLE